MPTYKVIAAVPDAKKDYKPEDEVAQRVGAGAPPRDLRRLVPQTVAINSFDGLPGASRDAKTITELAECYKHEIPKALEKVLALDGNHLSQIVDSFGHEAAGGDLPDVLQQPHDPPPRPARHLSAADGRQGAGIYGGSSDEKFS